MILAFAVLVKNIKIVVVNKMRQIIVSFYVADKMKNYDIMKI